MRGQEGDRDLRAAPGDGKEVAEGVATSSAAFDGWGVTQCESYGSFSSGEPP